MNREVLDEIANWMFNCLISAEKTKADKLEKIYTKMFDKQWKYYMRWKLF